MSEVLPPANDPTQLVPGIGSPGYWFALATYFAPFATAGSLVFAGISAINAMEQTTRLGAIQDLLEQISSQISQMQERITQEIADVEYKRVAAAVIGTIQSFSDYINLADRSPSDLFTLITNSNPTAYEIYEYVEDPNTVNAYVLAYGSLYSLLFPIQINMIQAYNAATSDVLAAIREIQPQYSSTHDRVIGAATTVAENRVTSIVEAQKTTVIRGDGSVSYPTWTWMVDGSQKVCLVATTAQAQHDQDVANAVNDATSKLEAIYAAAATAANGS